MATKKEQIMREVLAYVCHHYKIQTGNPLLDTLDIVTNCGNALDKVDAIPDENCGSCRYRKVDTCGWDNYCDNPTGMSSISKNDYCSRWAKK